MSINKGNKGITQEMAIKATMLAHCVKSVNNMVKLNEMDGDWILIRDKVYVKIHEFIDDLRNEEK